MIIDDRHKSWIVFTIALSVVSLIVYIVFQARAPEGPSGGSAWGLAFGILASLLMIFCGLLSLRKMLPGLPLGTAKAWLRAHIWLGLLTVPLVLFHAGFRFGGLLEQALMAVFILIIVSGIVGVILQHYLPRVMKTTMPAATIYEQIPHVCKVLTRSADKVVVGACNTLFDDDDDESEPTTDLVRGRRVLREFHLESVRPFLGHEFDLDLPLCNQSQATAVFAQVGESLPNQDDENGARLHDALAQLRNICDERRQLATQLTVHKWLHGWLLIHLPLCIALLVLGVVHAVMSIYY